MSQTTAPPLTFGARIRARRDELDIGLREMGRRLGVSHTAVRLWETDEDLPTLVNAVNLADQLDMSADELHAWVKSSSPLYEDLESLTRP